MGTNEEVLALQNQIKDLAEKLGWTQNALARKLYCEINEVDDEDEILRFQERFKKELQRPTTNSEKLKRYIIIIISHPDAAKLGLVFNKHMPLKAISDELSNGLMKISRELDRELLSGIDKS
jgi:hypothetical protein